MAITVYTYNDKVLKNVATDKWLKKPDAPAGFVMNASNVVNIYAIGSSAYAAWESPTYPDGYDGNGKHYVLVNNNPNSDLTPSYGFMYAQAVDGGGPSAISSADMSVIGQSEGTLAPNQAGTASGFGKYLTLVLTKSGITQADVEAYLANLTITILDP